MTAPIGFVIDANVVSEMMRPVPASNVPAFLDSIADKGLGLASITIWEILHGICGLTVVTRNESDFRNTGAAIVNPWKTPVK